MAAPKSHLAYFSAVAFLLTVTVGCSGDEPDADTMPDVVGQKLDVAQSDVQRAGYEDEVEVVGGGMFGVVAESNWTVCSQLPEAGESISEQPRLTVDRSCEDDDENGEEDPTTSEPSDDPSPAGDAETADSEQGEVLTAENNPALMSVLAVRDSCSESVKAFIKEHEGATIQFGGSIAAMQNHGDYDTRYDILVAPGNTGSKSGTGPSFQFRDVSMFDLNLVGPSVPDYVGVDDKFTFTADVVGEIYPNQANWNCLFRLDPVSTEVR